jgi:Trk K+ transport system NAD-binding subunit
MPSAVHGRTPPRQIRRMLRAQWRDAQVLFQESRMALLLFAALILGGATILRFFYSDPHTGETVGFAEALYATFALIFFESVLAFPSQWYLQLLYFLIPVFGLFIVADGVIRFGVALTNKQERGQKWQAAMASTYSGHVIVCGMGKVGYRVTQELLKLDREVVAIEANDGGRFVEKAKSLGIPVIIADARRTENIIKAGVLQAAAIIPCTDNELTNLDIALDAREINPQIKVVMRMFDPDLARRVEKGFGIHTALSTSALAAPVFAAASLNMNVKSSFYLEDQLLNVGEQTIQPGAQIEGWSIQKLENELDLTVISYCQAGELRLHPEPDLILNPGIKILVLASLETLHRLTEKNRPR